SITLPVAAITAATIGVPQAAGNIDLTVVAIALGLALLAPVLLFVLELAALRRMTTTAFGTLMAIEPAVALLLGLVVLSQMPTIVQCFGIVLVVLAGAAAQRRGHREPPASTGSAPRTDLGTIRAESPVGHDYDR
ncbi:EamA family transporter, partial [Nesterenkonia muleiensis]|uniref:EamA family transporter n=1 Tax=Nesterenkonia muleiensis TaxID=2282648 RepID=UPI001300999B